METKLLAANRPSHIATSRGNAHAKRFIAENFKHTLPINTRRADFYCFSCFATLATFTFAYKQLAYSRHPILLYHRKHPKN